MKRLRKESAVSLLPEGTDWRVCRQRNCYNSTPLLLLTPEENLKFFKNVSTRAECFWKGPQGIRIHIKHIHNGSHHHHCHHQYQYQRISSISNLLNIVFPFFLDYLPLFQDLSLVRLSKHLKGCSSGEDLGRRPPTLVGPKVHWARLAQDPNSTKI